ncbi:hypothetical protein BLNAU_21134 [Blattamonas nauphoetae]|uniref:Uncharacterized protein n=1 Tax=Blattamonas nauphoetae TaxID=2049346 RepID=A0ABQ9WZW2_9EUKA|nr:hypothetical protein BLNAU_21134 [Blattamonas nauphoetae]
MVATLSFSFAATLALLRNGSCPSHLPSLPFSPARPSSFLELRPLQAHPCSHLVHLANHILIHTLFKLVNAGLAAQLVSCLHIPTLSFAGVGNIHTQPVRLNNNALSPLILVMECPDSLSPHSGQSSIHLRCHGMVSSTSETDASKDDSEGLEDVVTHFMRVLDPCSLTTRTLPLPSASPSPPTPSHSPLPLPDHPHPPTPLCLSLATHTLPLPSASPSPPTPSHSPLPLPHHPLPPTRLCLSLTTHSLPLPSASPSPPTPSHSPLPLPHHPLPPTPLCLSLATHTLPLPSASP